MRIRVTRIFGLSCTTRCNFKRVPTRQLVPPDYTTLFALKLLLSWRKSNPILCNTNFTVITKQQELKYYCPLGIRKAVDDSIIHISG